MGARWRGVKRKMTHFFVFLSLLLGRVLDDRLLAVDGVLLHLVGQHSLHRLAAERLGNFRDHICHCRVLIYRHEPSLTKIIFSLTSTPGLTNRRAASAQ